MDFEDIDVDKLLKDILPAEDIKENRKCILVVDDDARVLRLISKYLEDYKVATATNGRAAFKFLETRTPDLILLDYEMPVEDGADVLKRLHANPITKEIPVVFLTGVADRKRIQEVLKLKPQGYLLKPVLRNKLLKIVEDILK